jgi:hypothetical protein
MARFLIALLFLLPINLMAQNDSCHLRISLLTASPGEDLYSTFGHSALRVTDSVSNTDIVYNYGTFNFDEPGFYIKFTRGKLLYYLSRDYFESFIVSYKEENRSITEQVLNLSCKEKQHINNKLQDNLLPQNLYYQYDFLFDNCTTRLRDLIEKATDSSLHINEVLKKPTRFRDLLHEYLDRNDKQWSKLGIDLLLGSKTDAIMKPREIMFLPDYLMKSLDNATLHSAPLVAQKESIFKIDYSRFSKDNLVHPIFIFTCLFVLIAILSFFKNSFVQNIIASFDGFLFFVSGLLGVLFLFMWLGTDHVMCENNYNLLWAWPTNLIAAFYVHSKIKWAKIYLIIYSLFNVILIASWFFLPQQLNPALIPIIGILIFRSWIILLKKNK